MLVAGTLVPVLGTTEMSGFQPTLKQTILIERNDIVTIQGSIAHLNIHRRRSNVTGSIKTGYII